MTLVEFDAQYRSINASRLCGADEAGRGPLAGPVFAAAVMLPQELGIDGLDDSKRLSEKKRELLFGIITERAEAFSVSSASVEEIESMNILNAALLAMDRAANSLRDKNGVRAVPDLILVDGNTVKGISFPAKAIVGGDGLSACVAAASILAKVSRDAHMRELDHLYPEYGFARHKGYGTQAHRAALEEYGPCPAHRPSFLKKLGLKPEIYKYACV